MYTSCDGQYDRHIVWAVWYAYVSESRRPSRAVVTYRAIGIETLPNYLLGWYLPHYRGGPGKGGGGGGGTRKKKKKKQKKQVEEVDLFTGVSIQVS